MTRAGRSGSAAGGLPTAALLLADGRFPSGGHAHSLGLEAAVADGRVRDLDTLGAFAAGRLATAGLCDAALTAATVRAAAHLGATTPWRDLDGEAAARITSPVLREVSRRLGRQLLRVAGETWPDPLLDSVVAVLPDGAHQAVALGATAAVAGLDERAAAVCAGYLTVSTVAAAAVRLLGLDPFAVSRLVAGLTPAIDAVATEAEAAAAGPLAQLPAPSAPLVDLAAEQHARWEVRLFAS